VGDVFSLFAFILSLVAVLLAGAALRRVNSQIAQDVRLRAAQARHLNQAITRGKDHRDRMARRQTFSEADLAPPPHSTDPVTDGASNGGAAYQGSGYPSAKSIELARELDRKRQEARRLAQEQGLVSETAGDDDSSRFVPTSSTRRPA